MALVSIFIDISNSLNIDINGTRRSRPTSISAHVRLPRYKRMSGFMPSGALQLQLCTSSERVQADGAEARAYQVPVACGPDEERELEAVFIDTGDIVA